MHKSKEVLKTSIENIATTLSNSNVERGIKLDDSLNWSENHQEFLTSQGEMK